MAEYKREFYQNFMSTVHQSADEVVPLVLEYITPASIVDVGCGTGSWLATFQRHGVNDIFGVDGPWVDADLLQIPRDRFQVSDLSKPLQLNRTFDLAVSLETGEHLPPASAREFVDSLTRLAPAVLFSAAAPFQGGYNHLNEQWPDYWAALFAEHRFAVVDCLRPRLWRNERVEWWYVQNMYFAVAEDALGRHPALARAREATRPDQLSIVHPRAYLESSVRTMSLWKLIQVTLGAARRSIKRH